MRRVGALLLLCSATPRVRTLVHSLAEITAAAATRFRHRRPTTSGPRLHTGSSSPTCASAFICDSVPPPGDHTWRSSRDPESELVSKQLLKDQG